ncbi:MAG: hypothetical protein NTX71_07480 [Candidatus Aureabacteria bacterium]|nr:hypothetical protein [Candidatus Auribacterota bacterium]
MKYLILCAICATALICGCTTTEQPGSVKGRGTGIVGPSRGSAPIGGQGARPRNPQKVINW